MRAQDRIGIIIQNPLSMSSNQMSLDVRASYASGGDGDEHHLKVRKPYTISKQREQWAEEEHRKFLEALQLYGRAWRLVEEHIGTKTAVQIRSHAQKFFSKVVRESAAEGSAKSIEIPPPRPKRKPAHPYPRKLGNNGGLSISKLERSLSLVKSAFEQENGSPTSVLSGVGSDILGSFLSNLPSRRCESPVASAAGSNEQDESVGEENNLQYGRTSVGLTTHAQSAMELDISSANAPWKKASPVEEQVPCLKLFGKTVLMTDSHKPSSPIPNPLPTLSVGIQDRSAHIGLEAPPQHFFQGASPGDLPQSLGKSSWSPCPGGMFPMFYPLQPSNFGDITNPLDARIIHLPWFPFIQQQGECSRQFMNQSFAEDSSDKEGSWTGSNSASAGEVGNPAVKRDRSTDTNDSSLLRSLSVRGFLPYKRRVVEKESEQQPLGVADDGEGPSIGLSL